MQTLTYDGYNRLVASLDAMGNLTTNRYDARGNLTNTLALGEVVDVPGGAGNVRLSETHFAYDVLDRRVLESRAFFTTTNQAPIGDGFATTTTLYADNSAVLVTVNDNHHARTNRYDTANRLFQVTDAKGNRQAMAYDANSNITNVFEEEISDVDGHVETFATTMIHDNLDRLTSTIDNVGTVDRVSYDSRNNQTMKVDGNTNVVRHVYDGLSRLTDTIRELTATGAGGSPVVDTIIIRQLWDDSSRLTAQVDDSTNATTYLYDGLNRKFGTMYADGTGQTNEFNVHGKPVRTADASGNTTLCTYDENDRLIRQDIAPGPDFATTTTFEVYKYDGMNRLVWAQNDDSLVTRSYDSLSGVTREVQNGQVVLCTYDSVENLTQCTYPGGRVITTTFDELERQKTISDQLGLIAQYYYVGPSRVARRDYGNGTSASYEYDGATGVPNPVGDFGVRQITRTAHTRTNDGLVLDDRSYRWDRAGNKIQRRDLRVGGNQVAEDYRYDSASRLTRSVQTATEASANTNSYQLDGVGNRVEVTGGTNAGPYTMSGDCPSRPTGR